ncbi:hypothetical protein PV328_006381 [Microctonus aethiopoides]|uniref:THAP-type domain-containing protein n=1 Tax=Microctonus aethiopoides TaxID=144406 RepID=A0AA39KTG2_9HYME|nr:hypothetical protein PV328_006381 [Microctonus aethiopoides]
MGFRKCCILHCSNTTKNSPYQFYHFPRAQHKLIQRAKWIDAVRKQNAYNSDWKPKGTDVICSAHFIGNKKGEEVLSPSYIPTKFSFDKNKFLDEDAIISRHRRFLKRKLQDKTFVRSVKTDDSTPASKMLQSTSDSTFIDQDNADYNNYEILTVKSNQDQGCQVDFFAQCHEFDKVFTCNRYIYGHNTCDAEIQTEIKIPTSKIIVTNPKRFKNQCSGTPHKTLVDVAVGPDSSTEIKSSHGITFQGCITKDEQFNDLTGVTFDHFEFLLKKLNMSENARVSKKQRLFIFLFKMKTGLTFSALSAMFSIHRTTVSRIFHSILTILVNATQDLVSWPHRLAVQATMPNCFKPQLSDTRVIIDCTEFRTEVPSVVKDRISCYSHHGKSFTAKVLIGITPGGFICFKSLAASGGKSDSQLTIESGLIDLLEDGDVVLADEVFPDVKTTLDSKGKKVSLVMLPLLENNKKFDKDETEATFTITKVRIHVVRIMQRLRTYQILNKIPENLFNHIDHIIHMCCVLVNLQSPIF